MDEDDTRSVPRSFMSLQETNGDVNQITPKSGLFPLLVAATNGNYPVVKWLLNHEADPNRMDKFSCVALSEVARRPCSCKDEQHARLLNGHVMFCRTEIGILLLEHGADPEIRSSSLASKGGDNCRAHNPQCIVYTTETGRRKAKKKGGPVWRQLRRLSSASDRNDGINPFMLAVKYGNVPMVVEILRRNANANAKDDANNTPLMIAATSGHLSLLKILVEHGAYLCDRQCKRKCETAWHRGIYNYKHDSAPSICRSDGFFEAFKYLSSVGAKA